MSKKILLDRSIFHRGNFDLLRNSEIKSHCSSYGISIYHSPILLEETLNLWWDLNKREELKKHLEFIIEICNGKWFRDLDEIWTMELEGYSVKDYLFLPEKERGNLESQIRFQIIEGNLNPNEENEMRKEVNVRIQKNKRMKEISKVLRNDVLSRLRNIGARPSSIKETFEKFVERNIDWFGEGVIKQYIRSAKYDADVLIRKWKENRGRFPYFTSWCKGHLYAIYHPMAKQNTPIDEKDIVDASQLVYLRGLDILVSNDRKFMKDAFLELYGSAKKLLSLDEFIKFLS